jgi:hypothetical protein
LRYQPLFGTKAVVSACIQQCYHKQQLVLEISAIIWHKKSNISLYSAAQHDGFSAYEQATACIQL